MAIVIAVANQKGGVAKTTSAVTLSAALALSNYRVLLIDLDPQASATLWLTNDYGPKGRVIHDVLIHRAKISDCTVTTPTGIALVPSNLWLSSLDLEMHDPRLLDKERRLAKAVQPVASQYDYILIDCPPSLGYATINAMAACDTCIIPIDCRAQALLAVPQLMENLANVSVEYGEAIRVYALPTFYEKTNLAREILSQIEEQFEAATLPTIHKNTRLAEAFAVRQTIYQFDPTALGAMDYKRAAKELADDLTPKPRAEGRARRTT